MFLTSNDNVEERPEWLEGEKNIPVMLSSPEEELVDGDKWRHTDGRTYRDQPMDEENDEDELS
ncbi:hypothetical protein, partial [Streptobacillus moniliformis]|uniref:hypothetical protein n=1 Tax=Streptobacillus moniliformis TaxID=34105 RepID=UPI001E385FBD